MKTPSEGVITQLLVAWGEGNKEALDKLIPMAKEKGNENEDGLLEPWEILDLDLKAEMVVLSACETATTNFESSSVEKSGIKLVDSLHKKQKIWI